MRKKGWGLRGCRVLQTVGEEGRRGEESTGSPDDSPASFSQKKGKGPSHNIKEGASPRSKSLSDRSSQDRLRAWGGGSHAP